MCRLKGETMNVIEIKKRVYDRNNEKAEELRNELKSNGTFMMNLMSSPGSGKTTLVVSIIDRLKERYGIGVIEADLDSEVDALTVEKTGTRVIQLHSGGMCHLDAGMARQGLNALQYTELDFVILENIGNLICPAQYDLGQAINVMILSVPEGDDKPLKYPTMFKEVDVLLISKTDTMEYFNFDLQLLETRVKSLNPSIRIFPLSAKVGDGMEVWCDFLREGIESWK